jgi:hypothetical protein
MTLDNVLIFHGEIAKAASEAVVFSVEDVVLDTIDEYSLLQNANAVQELNMTTTNVSLLQARPTTSDGLESQDEEQGYGGMSVDFSMPRPKTSRRPVTSAVTATANTTSSITTTSTGLDNAAKTEGATKIRSLKLKTLKFHILSTWGDLNFAGLTQLDVLDANLNRLEVNVNMVQAHPQDINSIAGHSGDTRTLDKLIDGMSVTTDDNHMWLAPTVVGIKKSDGRDERGDVPIKGQWLQFSWPETVEVSAIRVWNYNKSYDDTARGIKWVRVEADGVALPGQQEFLFRKALGHDQFDAGQMIYLCGEAAVQSSSSERVKPYLPQFNLPVLPCGCNIVFKCFSTWGDPHYIGLNGIEIFDEHQQPITVEASEQVSAIPASINDLPNCSDDVRTIDKLFNGVYDSTDKTNTWLAPYQRLNGSKANYISVVFDSPQKISCMRIWNLAAQPGRGVKHLQVYIDGLLVFEDNLQPYNASDLTHYTPIVFCNNAQLVDRESKSIVQSTARVQSVRFFDEGQEKTPSFKLRGRDLHSQANESLMSSRANYPVNRPTTMASRPKR